MSLHNETPPLRTNAGNGGLVVSKAVTAKNYQNTTFTATDLAVASIAHRFCLSLTTARLVCELAGIGGRA